MEKTRITFQENNDPATPPADEAVRQVYSALALVRDRLFEIDMEHQYSAEQQTAFETADELLRRAHSILRKTVVPAG